MADEQYFVDEFFAPDEDAGRAITITVKGRRIPITLSARPITNADKLAAQFAATTLVRQPDGTLLPQTDAAQASMELAARKILAWPFVDRASGAKLPITGANVARMLGGAEEVIAQVSGLDGGEEQAAAPFVAPSDAG